jgi:dTDP-4-amino-4,6-dideoxygalactose transaminase
MPYLRRIDAARWYSNRGALAREFEARLAERIALSAQGVALLSNATTGLALALQALAPPAGSICMIPAWTFAASAHAAVMAGLTPWFVDVEEASWTLTPDAAHSLLAHAPGQVGAIMVIEPFGYPVDVAAWEDFSATEGCAVVVDAAAAFNTVRASSLPIVVSLHATKILGVGEGAFVACRDPDVIASINSRANFGFAGAREATVEATNAKLSEYAAAVGLAGLDRWDRTRSEFQVVANEYARALDGVADVSLQPGYGVKFISTTANVVLPDAKLEAVEDALSAAGCGTRRWWGGGLAEHRAFRHFPRESTPITERLGRTVLGLPCWSDLPARDIRYAAEVIARACAAS